MRTSDKIGVTAGEVHVNHGPKGIYGTTIVTDPRATDRSMSLSGGAECRDATPAEITKATADGTLKHVNY